MMTSISVTEASHVDVGSVIPQQLAEKDATHTSSKAWNILDILLLNKGSKRNDGTPFCNFLALYISFHGRTISSMLNPIPVGKVVSIYEYISVQL